MFGISTQTEHMCSNLVIGVQCGTCAMSRRSLLALFFEGLYATSGGCRCISFEHVDDLSEGSKFIPSLHETTAAENIGGENTNGLRVGPKVHKGCLACQDCIKEKQMLIGQFVRNLNANGKHVLRLSDWGATQDLFDESPVFARALLRRTLCRKRRMQVHII